MADLNTQIDTSESLKPLTDYIDSFYNEGIPYEIKISPITALLLLIIVVAPIVAWLALKNKK
jgi:hypothetical protein